MEDGEAANLAYYMLKMWLFLLNGRSSNRYILDAVSEHRR